MPDGCTARVVKNTLMRLACKGTPYENLSEITTGENFWMFVEGDDNLAAPIKFLGEFAKTMDKDNVSFCCCVVVAVVVCSGDGSCCYEKDVARCT